VITGAVDVVEVVSAAVVDDEEHDANTIDITNEKSQKSQNVPLFIKPPFILVLREHPENYRQVIWCKCWV